MQAPLVTKKPYKVIPLNVDGDANELEWCKVLAAKIGGETEVSVKYGRVDILTDTHAIEVDWITKYYEGIGQALHYANQTGKKPVVAIALKGKRGVFAEDKEKVRYISELCGKHGIAVWVLVVEP